MKFSFSSKTWMKSKIKEKEPFYSHSINIARPNYRTTSSHGSWIAVARSNTVAQLVSSLSCRTLSNELSAARTELAAWLSSSVPLRDSFQSCKQQCPTCPRCSFRTQLAQVEQRVYSNKQDNFNSRTDNSKTNGSVQTQTIIAVLANVARARHLRSNRLSRRSNKPHKTAIIPACCKVPALMTHQTLR